ncbi:MAG: hypothetical protein NTX16_04065 [Actinobacteria bacterium]|nr:hypothetical protein [Actinomycetota bacterium]
MAVLPSYDDSNVNAGQGAMAAGVPGAPDDDDLLPAPRRCPRRAAGERRHITVKPCAKPYGGET